MVLGTQPLLCTHTEDFVDTEYRITDSVPEVFGRHWLAACNPSVLAPQSFPSDPDANVRVSVLPTVTTIISPGLNVFQVQQAAKEIDPPNSGAVWPALAG